MKCSQASCDADATREFDWPGHEEPLLGCDPCAEKAITVARALGFKLHTIELGEATENNDQEEAQALKIKQRLVMTQLEDWFPNKGIVLMLIDQHPDGFVSYTANVDPQHMPDLLHAQANRLEARDNPQAPDSAFSEENPTKVLRCVRCFSVKGDPHAEACPYFAGGN